MIMERQQVSETLVFNPIVMWLTSREYYNEFIRSRLNSQIKERQYSYNVTWRSFRATIVAVKKQSVLHILSVYL
jgi:hypothetical protein